MKQYRREGVAEENAHMIDTLTLTKKREFLILRQDMTTLCTEPVNSRASILYLFFF